MIEIPTSLPAVEGVDLGQLVGGTPMSSEATALYEEGMGVPEYLTALQEQQLAPDAVRTLAHSLPEQQAVQWAAASCDMVSAGLDEADAEAVAAAAEWAEEPSPEAASAATEAANGLAANSPAFWTAQAAGWSQAVAIGGAATGGLSEDALLTGTAVTGAVLLAAGMSGAPEMAKPPSEVPPMPEISMPEIPEFGVPAFEMPEMPKIEVPGLEGLPLESPELGVPQWQAQVPTTPESVPAEALPEMWERCEPFLEAGIEMATSGPTGDAAGIPSAFAA